MSGPFAIEPLGSGEGRRAFCSDVMPLDRYLHEVASQDVRRRLSNCFVARDEAGRIAGYYTLAASSLPLTDLVEADIKNLPRYGAVPAGLIGRLAVDTRFRGLGLGGSLIMDAARRASVSEPAIFPLLVDAKDKNAAAFYRHLGFRRFVSRPMSFYISIMTMRSALGLPQ